MKKDNYPSAIEMPIELWINSNRITTFMGSPYDLEDLAIGNLLTRGMVKSTNDIKSIEVNEETLQIFVETKNSIIGELYSVPEFILSGTSSVNKFNDSIYSIPKVHSDFSIELKEIVKFANIMVDEAIIYHQTGGVHSAIVVDGVTKKYYLREDIGRHSAVDKSVGAAVKGNVDFSTSFICTSGRISLDMLLKSAAIGIPIVSSLKYPSDIGIQLAEHYNISIVAKILNDEPLVYSNRQRIK